MADTKKEHYVPRCYLENFVGENDRIQVFDKYKMQIRSQKIIDVAMENYFYDIKFDELIQRAESEGAENIKKDLMEIVGADDWGEVLERLDEKYLEKEFFCTMEGIYSQLLQQLIAKSYNGNQWVIDNCFMCSEIEKELMSLFIAIQILRTKVFREKIAETIEKTYQTLAYKMQMNNEDALPKEAFEVEVNKDFVKLQHSSMILDEEIAVHTAEILYNHIWVMYVNKTEYPFFTSDNPVANIPHKFDEYVSYGGLKSEGIEIVFPITPNLMIAMYDKNTYVNLFADRKFVALTLKEQIDIYNQVQVINSDRCVFSIKNNFELAEQYCKQHPEMQKYHSRIEVG